MEESLSSPITHLSSLLVLLREGGREREKAKSASEVMFDLDLVMKYEVNG